MYSLCSKCVTVLLHIVLLHIADVLIVFSLGIGSAIGALSLYFFKNPATKAKNAALFVFIMSAVGLPFCFGYFAYCPSVEIAGVNIR